MTPVEKYDLIPHAAETVGAALCRDQGRRQRNRGVKRVLQQWVRAFGFPVFGSLWIVCLGAFWGVPSSGAAEPSEPGEVLVAGQNDREWQALFAKLAAQGDVHSTFTEERWFAVRKEPVILHGELRHSAEYGLSLHYTDPQEQILVVDAKGLLMRDAGGHTRTLAADPHAPRMDAVLLPVLRFDLTELRRFFTMRAARAGADWRIDFVPTSPELHRQLSTLTVWGSGEAVRQLEFRRAANQRVVVHIDKTETGVVFTSEVIKRFFR